MLPLGKNTGIPQGRVLLGPFLYLILTLIIKATFVYGTGLLVSRTNAELASRRLHKGRNSAIAEMMEEKISILREGEHVTFTNRSNVPNDHIKWLQKTWIFIETLSINLSNQHTNEEQIT